METVPYVPLCAIPHARSAALGGLLTARPSLEAAYKVRSIGRHLSLLKEEEKVLRKIKDEERLRAATSDPSLLRTPGISSQSVWQVAVNEPPETLN